jgi:23S rRNA pseudoU1915 N3-methylase RlmH
MAETVEDMLRLLRLEDSAAEFTCGAVEVQAAAAACAERFAAEAARRGLELALRAEPGPAALGNEKLLKLVPAGSYLFVLDVYGEELSSEELAERIDKLGVSGRSSLTFLIGGAFGLSREVRQAADMKLSFSRMTFTHQMVRLLLVEQIYRAFKINRGEKYHW